VGQDDAYTRGTYEMRAVKDFYCKDLDKRTDIADCHISYWSFAKLFDKYQEVLHCLGSPRDEPMSISSIAEI
jgi:hypothetical protein